MSTRSPGPSSRRSSTAGSGTPEVRQSIPSLETPGSSSLSVRRTTSPSPAATRRRSSVSVPPQRSPSPAASSTRGSRSPSPGKGKVQPPALKASESIEQALARLELEMPSDTIFSVPALAPPSIPVRSTSPLPLRATVPTEVAFGRHQSPPPPQRPASPERLDRPFRRFDGQPACENGCPRPACFWCDRCEIQLCGACDAGIHDRNAALRRHERVHLMDRLEMCPVHREGKRLFCSECTMLVCQRCVATDLHKFPDGRGHPIFDMGTAANARRPEIQDMARQIEAVAAHAPQTLHHLNNSLLSAQAHIDSVCDRLRKAVDDYQSRMTRQLHDFLSGDVDLMERFIASTAASRARLELDAQNAQALAARDTPPQTFLQQWRDLRSQLAEDVKARLGQSEPESIKMNVEFTGQVQGGRIMTLEMEIQRVFDALDKCGQIVNVPRNGTGRAIPLSPPASPSK